MKKAYSLILTALLLLSSSLCLFSCAKDEKPNPEESRTEESSKEPKAESSGEPESVAESSDGTSAVPEVTDNETDQQTEKPQQTTNTTKAQETKAPDTTTSEKNNDEPNEPDEITYAEPFTVYVTSNSLNVRTGPSTSYKKIDTLYNHEAVTVIGKSGDWYIINSGSDRGYCYADYTTAKAPEYNYKSPYLIKVNRLQNIVIVYEKDESGEFTVAKKAMVCSVGLNDNTPCGIFNTTYKYEWLPLYGGVQGQYITRIVKDIVFHSVPYYTQNKNDIEYEEFNKLGEPASLGCVRLLVKDTKWIYDNVPEGTTVIIYDSADPEPLEKPVPPRIDVTSPNRGWDPTDPDPNNPVYIG